MSRVYFASADGLDLIKVGRSRDPKKRLAQLQSLSPVKLRLLTTISGGTWHERAVQKLFKKARSHGEWFRASPEIVDFISNVVASGEEYAANALCPHFTKEETTTGKAIKLAGGPSKLSRVLGIKPQAVSQWNRVPDNHVLKVEAATGGAVTRFELRPDIFGKK